ncbi:glutamyl-tRNA reductase [Haloferacaceae archaeon DSL9]
MMRTGVITGVSVSHLHASVDEIADASEGTIREVVSTLRSRPDVAEAFAIQTCNRSEAYVVTDRAEQGRAALSVFAASLPDGTAIYMSHEESLRHLMRVASGLESLVLGEDQILGQFKTAFEESRAADGIGPLLDDAVTKAIHVGERARTETGINEGAVSLGSAAVKLAERELELAGATALVVGAGEMGTLTARALDAAGINRLIIANRTVPHAEHLATDVDATASAVGLDAVPAASTDVDLLISATGSPSYVIDDGDLADAERIVCIDIAQPRDVDPSADSLDGVSVYDIDALEAVTNETQTARRREADRVEAMIDEEFEHLLASFKRKRADEAISAMYESAERVKGREVETAVAKLESQGELTDEQRETVGALADALVGQLLAAPTKSLRDAAQEDDWTTIQTAMRLFDPEFDVRYQPPSADRPPHPQDIPTSGSIPPHVLEQLSDD